MNKEALKRLTGSLAFRIAVVLLILYTLYHCITANSDRVTTDVVTIGSERRILSGCAVIVRDEQVLTETGGPYLLSYSLEDGARVNVSSTVATLYGVFGDEEARTAKQAALLSLDRQIREALAVSTWGDTLNSLSDIREGIRRDVMDSLIIASDGGSLRVIEDEAFSALIGLNRDAALTHRDGSIEGLIDSLRLSRSLLLGGAESAGREIRNAGESGYFYYASRVDGYESVFTPNVLSSLNLSSFDRLTAAEPVIPGGTTVGKIVCGFHWSVILPLSEFGEGTLTVGEAYPLSFRGDGVTVSVTLDRVIGSSGDGRALLVFSSMDHPDGLSYTRFSDVELTVGEVTGYRVPETALCQVDGAPGVYILDGGRVSFRAIQTEYVGDGYVLVHIPTAEERAEDADGFYAFDHYLGLRDVVITGGKNLYDGKYID